MSRPRAARPGAEAVLDKLRAAMERAGLDALLVMSPENVLYVAGVVPASLRTVRTRLACCIVPLQGATELIVVELEKGAVEPACRLDVVTTYREFDEDAVAAAAASLRARGLSDGVVGMEATYLPASHFDHLRELMPGARFEAIDALLANARSIKTAEEIEEIETIGRAAQQVGEQSLGSVAAGDTEKRLGETIAERYREVGGELTMLVVGSGPRSALANATPSDRVLGRGDVVRIDVIGHRNNYCSDVARTAVVGSPAVDQRRLYGTLRDVHERILERLRPGVLTTDLYSIYRDAMERAGLPRYHFVGHGLGITLHEDPFISDRRPVALEENMVLCIEPMALIEGSHGMQIEDEVVITPDGCRPITEAAEDPLEIDG